MPTRPLRIRALPQLNARVVACQDCRRLTAHCREVAQVRRRAYRDESYWGRPVPSFGDPRATILIVGLAPGAHGANRTGRMFTGDASGDFLYAALHRAGLANQAASVGRGDGLHLVNCYITAAVRCAPPGNRPSPVERQTCLPYLVRELSLLKALKVCLCLGQIAFEQTQRALGTRLGRFAHCAEFGAQCPQVVCSYHVSRQNTQTGRLTPAMFDAVVQRVTALAAGVTDRP